MENNEINKKYYIGLDMGTSSIGWAVTNDDYKLIQKRKQYLWGVRLFNETSTAKDRRLFRRQRRTINKRNWRLHLLKQELKNLVLTEDPDFFIKLKNSKFNNGKFTLFDDKLYNDVHYYKEFPTIYHLRLALTNQIKCEEFIKRNFYYRFLFLAINDILKTRGHFNVSGNFDFNYLNKTEDISIKMEEIIETLNEESEDIDIINKEKFLSLFKKYQKDNEINTKSKDKETQLLKLILGYEVNLSKLFDLELSEELKISFSELWEEKITKLNRFEITLHKLFEVYSMIRIRLFIKDSSSISEAKVKLYEKHRLELRILKSELKKIDEELKTNYYYEIFNLNNNEFPSYSNYVGKIFNDSKKKKIRKGTNQEELVKYLNKIKAHYVSVFPNGNLLMNINEKDYLILPNNSDNRLLPYQIHLNELKSILENFIKLCNKIDSRTISEHILTLLEFKVPYYIGPLSNDNNPNNKNYWLKKITDKENQKITPYNFHQIVDKKRSNNAFVGKMLRKCTYLQNETCLPQETISYQKYIFYNTINKIKLNDRYMNRDEKSILFEELVKTNKLNKKILIHKLGLDSDTEITGFGKDDNSSLAISLSSIKTFRELFPGVKNPFYESFYDNVIKEIAMIDHKDLDLKKEIIQDLVTKNPIIKITDYQIDSLTKLYSGKWGNLSEKFLLGILFVDSFGEYKNLLSILEENNYNLMEIIYLKDENGLNRNRDIIDKENNVDEFPSNSHELNQYLLNKYIPPQARRPIIQANLLIDEIVKIMGYEPDKILVEFTREKQQNPRETQSRYQALYSIYSQIKSGEFDEEVKEKLYKYKEENDKLKSKKIYLYFLQCGKDIYSSEPIDFDLLISDNKMYDIDHIWPQSKIKDDSLNNLVLTKTQYNDEKSDKYPINENIQEKQLSFWTFLKKINLMSSKKFERLTRKEPISDQELNDFVARQKTTLDWINIETAELFSKKFNKNINDFIVFSKSKHVVLYRQEKNWIKIREINNFHHAHDAYLNILVGDILNKHLTAPYQSIKTFNVINILKYFITEEMNKYAEKIFKYKDLLITKKTEIKNTGGFWDQNIVSPKENKKNDSYFPIKKGMDVNKYGGYNKISTAFFSILKKNDIKTIQSIPIIDCSKFYVNGLFDKNKFSTYIKNKFDSEIIEYIIPLYSKIIIDGVPMRISGISKNNILYHNTAQLIINSKFTKIIKLIMKHYKDNRKPNDADNLYKNILKEYKEENPLEKTFENMYHYIINNPDFSKNTKDRFKTLNNINILDYFASLSVLEKIDIIYTVITKLTKANASNQGKLFGCHYVDFSKNSKINYNFAFLKESITGFFYKKVDIHNV